MRSTYLVDCARVISIDNILTLRVFHGRNQMTNIGFRFVTKEGGLLVQIVIVWISLAALIQRDMIQRPPLKLHVSCGHINQLQYRFSNDTILPVWPVRSAPNPAELDELCPIISSINSNSC